MQPWGLRRRRLLHKRLPTGEDPVHTCHVDGKELEERSLAVFSITSHVQRPGCWLLAGTDAADRRISSFRTSHVVMYTIYMLVKIQTITITQISNHRGSVAVDHLRGQIPERYASLSAYAGKILSGSDMLKGWRHSGRGGQRSSTEEACNSRIYHSGYRNSNEAKGVAAWDCPKLTA